MKSSMKAGDGIFMFAVMAMLWSHSGMPWEWFLAAMFMGWGFNVLCSFCGVEGY